MRYVIVEGLWPGGGLLTWAWLRVGGQGGKAGYSGCDPGDVVERLSVAVPDVMPCSVTVAQADCILVAARGILETAAGLSSGCYLKP